MTRKAYLPSGKFKALNILKINRTSSEALGDDKSIIAIYDEAIKELEDIQSNINTSIEEIEYALAKPYYADVYLNNALRFLKGEK